MVPEGPAHGVLEPGDVLVQVRVGVRVRVRVRRKSGGGGGILMEGVRVSAHMNGEDPGSPPHHHP